MKISVSMIVKNESKNLPRCLGSLKEFDEIVIYDTGSTDDTIQVATSLGAKVFQGDPIEPFHFAEARNRALEHCSNDWIFSVDADEELKPGSSQIIKSAIDRRGPTGVTGLKIKFILGTERDAFFDRLVVFRKSIWNWEYRIHEELYAISKDKGGFLLVREAVLAHTRPLVSEKPSHRVNQNFELLKIEILENPQHHAAWKHLGLEYCKRGLHEDGIRCLRRYISVTKDPEIHVSNVMTTIAQSYASMRRVEDALDWCRKASDVTPSRREPLWIAAQILELAGRQAEAVSYLKRVLEIPASKRPNHHLDWPSVWTDLPEKALKWYKEKTALGGGLKVVKGE